MANRSICGIADAPDPALFKLKELQRCAGDAGAGSSDMPHCTTSQNVFLCPPEEASASQDTTFAPEDDIDLPTPQFSLQFDGWRDSTVRCHKSRPPAEHLQSPQGQTPHLFPPAGEAYPFEALSPDLPSDVGESPPSQVFLFLSPAGEAYPSDTTSLGLPSDVGESSPGRVPTLAARKRDLSI
ncbi:hypothetical protein Q8A67_000052 [Cirrhinus molitorella]|uniref:Uncharacterized protein n=1 Tax=Cirrhinus molitorella TaxID=172907 RepID=A0AA88QEL3_9TELE|nr:hypothetical protein Q8A67_000052 [Cirrhinus molitorella]